MIPNTTISAGSMSIGDAPPEPVVVTEPVAIPPRDEIRTRAKRYELPLARNYVQRWGVTEAVREILQNAIDSESAFEHTLAGGNLVVRSRKSVLSPTSLLLGSTSKAADDEKIGSFGEGYKIALLVLLRNGYQVVVRNGDRVWIPEFNFSHAFGADVLCIRDEPAASFHEGVAFEIGGLSTSDADAILRSCLLMQPAITDAIETSRGRILPSHGGKLYVGGLFITTTTLNYGYDMKPQCVKLERDRQTVSDWDLAMQTTQMWLETQRWDQIAALMKADAKDVAYAEFWGGTAKEALADACHRLFQAAHAGKVVVKSQDEADELARRGVSRDGIAQVPSNSGYYAGIRASSGYKSSVAQVSIAPKPAEILQHWLDAQRAGLGEGAITSFEALIRDAANWSAK